MIKQFLFSAVMLLGAISFAQTSGGPDPYGYTWKNSLDANGPAYQWIDISQKGTLVAGLSDDNSMGWINIGFPFVYYWGKFDKVRIGSNGWISFENTQNIAHGFPDIPTPGGSAGDNYLAPFMADLSFDGAGNPGKCYYWTNYTDTFIVTFENVPYWTATAPGYTGSNSFQVILTNSDSSITFQYQNVQLPPQMTNLNDLVIGIENIIGNMGFENYLDQIPPNQLALKYDHPGQTSYQVIDIQTQWVLNPKNGAEFKTFLDTVWPALMLVNGGNAAVNTPFQVSLFIKDQSGALVYSGYDTIQSLNVNDSSVVQFSLPFIPGSLGTHTVIGGFLLFNDQNPGNDARSVELNIVTKASQDVVLDYGTGAQDGSLSWNGGNGGAGIYIEPPYYPFTIKKLEYDIPTAGGDGFYARILDDDGQGGSAGTVLYDSLINGNQVAGGGYHTVNMSGTVTIQDGGFYVAWLMGGPNISLGMTSDVPISNQTFEVLNNAWTPYRERSLNDFRIRVIGDGDCNFNPVLNLSGNQILCLGSSVTLKIQSPPGNNQWNNGNNGDSLVVTQPGDYFAIVTTQSGCVDTTPVVHFDPATPIVPSITYSGGTLFCSAAQSYQWYLNGNPIPGATASQYQPTQSGNYSAETTDINGCKAVSNVIQVTITGIDNKSVPILEVYPVPADETLCFGSTENDQWQIRLLNLAGETLSGHVFTGRGNNCIETGALPAGIYLVEAVSGGKKQMLLVPVMH